jgi:hypothetical protein
MRRKGLALLFLIFFTVFDLTSHKQLDFSLDQIDLSGVSVPDMSLLIMPVINQVINSFGSQIQKNINSKKNSNQVHFVSLRDELLGNYFIKDHICFVNVDVLREDKTFYKSSDISIEKITQTIVKANQSKINQEVDFIVVYMNVPFYTYYQHSNPGIINIFKNDPIYRNEIASFDSFYLEYLNQIAELLITTGPDIIISKCEDVVFEHNVIECGENKFIHSYLIETDEDLLEFGASDVPTRQDVVIPTIPVELTLLFPNTLTLDLKTSDGIDAALTLLNSLSVTIDDQVDIKATSPLNINITDTLDIRITGTPLDVRITDTIIVSTDLSFSLSNLSLDLSTTLNVRLTDSIQLDTTTPLDIKLSDTIDIRMTDTIYVDIAADSLSINLTDTVSVKAWDNINVGISDPVDIDVIGKLDVKITDSIPVNLKEPIVGGGDDRLDVKTGI